MTPARVGKPLSPPGRPPEGHAVGRLAWMRQRDHAWSRVNSGGDVMPRWRVQLAEPGRLSLPLELRRRLGLKKGAR
jgi:hypothetical protein